MSSSQPEWFLTHVQNVSQEHSAFLKDVVQGLLFQTEYRQIVAWVIIFLLLTSKANAQHFTAFIVQERVYVSSVAIVIKKT